MDSKLAAKLNASVAVAMGCVLSLRALTPASCAGLTFPVLPQLSISVPSPQGKSTLCPARAPSPGDGEGWECSPSAACLLSGSASGGSSGQRCDSSPSSGLSSCHQKSPRETRYGNDWGIPSLALLLQGSRWEGDTADIITKAQDAGYTPSAPG